MAITKLPAQIQAAFNEIIVETNSENDLMITKYEPSPSISGLIHSVPIGGIYTFNLNGFLSKLFTDVFTEIPTNVFRRWLWNDYNLKMYYLVGGSSFCALNAVSQLGKPVNMQELNINIFLSHRFSPEDRDIDIPVYEGFPIGISVMYNKSSLAWILDTGYWNDQASWIDERYWND